jgi:hypothetical protein
MFHAGSVCCCFRARLRPRAAIHGAAPRAGTLAAAGGGGAGSTEEATGRNSLTTPQGLRAAAAGGTPPSGLDDCGTTPRGPEGEDLGGGGGGALEHAPAGGVPLRSTSQ